MSEKPAPDGTATGSSEQGSVEMFEVLEALAKVVGATNAPAGAACCRVLATMARRMTLTRVAEVARAAEAQAAAEAQRVAATMIAIALESDGLAVTLDGGPSDLSARAWIKSFEQEKIQP